jgi:hypothetical protein
VENKRTSQMKTKDRYPEMLAEYFQQFRVSELNEKIKLLNQLFEKEEGLNIISMPEIILSADVDFSKVNKNDQKKEGVVYGGIKELIRKTVKNMGVSRVDKETVFKELQKNGNEVKMATIAGALKKWSLEKDPNGIRRTIKGKGTQPSV